MSKEMADKQQNADASKPATTKKTIPQPDRQAEEERWLQNALEDDDVREALKAFHSRDKSR